MNPWNQQAWFPPGYVPPTYASAPSAQPGYWQNPAPTPKVPAWQEPNPDAYFSTDRNKTRKNPNLHPILSADTTHVRIDIRKSPSIEGVHSSAYYAYRHAYATVNRAPHIRLISEDFPWSVDIKPKFATPVTCEDVWNALYTAMQQPLADSEWGMVAADRDRVKKIERAAKKRQEADKGKRLKRIDWLAEAFIFKGLERDEEFSERRTAYTEEDCSDTWVVKMSTS